MYKETTLYAKWITNSDNTEESNDYPKPNSTDLDFWITDDVKNFDFSEYPMGPHWFGTTEYLGKGYSSADTEYVSYLISVFPDYADGGEFIARITITDPFVKIVDDLIITSTINDLNKAFKQLGYNYVYQTEEISSTWEFCENWISDDEVVNIRLIKYKDGNYRLIINANVTNRDNIIF